MKVSHAWLWYLSTISASMHGNMYLPSINRNSEESNGWARIHWERKQRRKLGKQAKRVWRCFIFCQYRALYFWFEVCFFCIVEFFSKCWIHSNATQTKGMSLSRTLSIKIPKIIDRSWPFLEFLHRSIKAFQRTVNQKPFQRTVYKSLFRELSIEAFSENWKSPTLR